MKTFNSFDELRNLKTAYKKVVVKDDIDKHVFKPTSKIKVYLFDDMFKVNSRVSIETAKRMCKENKKAKLHYELGNIFIVI